MQEGGDRAIETIDRVVGRQHGIGRGTPLWSFEPGPGTDRHGKPVRAKDEYGHPSSRIDS
jgi:hypothetical protein